jgi:T6SS, Phospholipase effector Tle1-like, catalytic domain
MANQVHDNISTIAISVLPVDSHGVPQIIWYQGGVGTGAGPLNALTGATTGSQIRQIVRDGYMFIVNNYVPGTEIYLFGWSRGAYSARVISGLIADVGVLKVTGTEYFGKMFETFFDPAKPTRDVVPVDQVVPAKVECVAVWETVGSLGIPSSSILGWGIPIINTLIEKWNEVEWYRFLNTALPSTSKVGLQAYIPHLSLSD